jgi:signal transduction histidine kinase/ActR/RegA family two-component response regulator
MSPLHDRQVRVAAAVILMALEVACAGRSHRRADSLRTIAEVKSSASGEHPNQVQFEGVVTVVNSNFGYFVVQDATAGTRVQPARFTDSSLIGHRVEITGYTPLGLGADTISDAAVRDLGVSNLPDALPISAAELRKDTFDGKRIALVGTARLGHVDSSGQLVIPISIGGFEIAARFIDDHGISPEQVADADVQVTGVASPSVDIDGRVTDLTILVQDASGLKIQRSAPDPRLMVWQSVKTMAEANGRTRDHRVRLHGRIQSSGDSSGFRFIDLSGSITIANAVGLDMAQDSEVDLVAFVVSGSGGLELHDVRPTFTAADLSSQSAKGNDAAIRSVAGLRALPAEDAALEKPLSLEGVVTYYDPSWQMMFFQDRSGGVYVSLHGEAKPTGIAAGDKVAIRAVSGAGDFAPIVHKARFRLLKRATFPAPSTLSAETVFSGLADSQWVELEGIVQNIGLEANHPFAKLSWGLHEYKVLLPPGVTLPRDWTDKRFRVRGACGTLFNGKRQVLGIQLFAPGLEQFSELSDSELAGGGKPKPLITPIDKLLQFAPNEVPGHRVRLRGKVAAAHPAGPTWIRDDSGAVVIRDHNEISLANGDIVEVVGFAFPGAFSAEIREATIEKRASSPAVRPADVTPDQALFGGLNGQLVKIAGRLISEYRTGQEQTLLLQSGKTIFRVHGPENLPPFASGSVLRISGICTVTAKRFRGVLVPISFEIAVDSPTSVSVIENAPWLTQQRTFRALGGTMFLVAAALVWVIMLRRRVSGQTRLIEQKLLEVETLKEKAEAASAAKSQFLANMSHEIRTPMNGILGMTELAMQAESPEEQRECLTTIRSSGDALLAILNDLLDLSKIEAGKFALDLAPFSLRELIQEAGKVFALSMRKKGLKFQSSVADTLPDLLLGDALRLRQILLNLLGNAVKFTKEGFVALEAAGERVGDQVHLRVLIRDSGIGIAREKQERIFEAFGQADDSTARNYGGTGLGLSICVKLVALMNGEIGVTSEPGRGSVFSVSVCLNEAVVGSAAAPKSVFNAEARSAAPLNILVAEDNLVNQTLAVKLLSKRGHRVAVAANGRLAVEQFQRGTFDLILMDVQMPEMDGWAATIEIRRLEQTGAARIPIIAMTAQTMTGDRDRCFAAGMDGFVSKPIRLPELFAAIATLPPSSTRAASRQDKA